MRVRLALFLWCISNVTWGGESPPSDSLGNELERDSATAAAEIAFFESHIRPILENHCLDCHSTREGAPQGDLNLTTREGWQRGGKLGPAIVPGNPSSSLLLEAIEQTGDRLRMPPDSRLSEREIQAIRQWIERGAPDPRLVEATDPSSARQETGSIPWSFHPRPTTIACPAADRSAQQSIDTFLAEARSAQGLRPVPLADAPTLIRRITLDLTGLPPTPEEVDQFVTDRRPDAYERLVDRLLASPRYGERWGRFWLDVARYADSNGLDENIALGNAWRYRDYVVAAFNSDKPFDHFVQEQLAGDLLVDQESTTPATERLIATGFLSLGPKVLAEVDETKMEMDIVDEQVESVGRAFLALTLGCARCHDHKFDPISTEDYYGLAGIFKSTRTMEHFKKIARWNEVSLASPAECAQQEQLLAAIQQHQTSLKRLQDEMSQGSAPTDSTQPGTVAAERQVAIQQLQQQLQMAQAAVRELPSAMAVTDYPQPMQLAVHLRGNHLTLGRVVPRRVPAALSSESFAPPELPSTSSGRKELARWLVDPRHPLTARVLVNRVWRWHFGQGLSPSTDNFGQLGEPPELPHLLDWLANRLLADGWSIKQLHRQIVLSHTYRLSSQYDPHNAAIDPANRYLWRHRPARLDVEAIRDSMLYVSGKLDSTMGGSLLHVKNREFLFDHTSKDETRYDVPRRSIYLPVIRNHLYDMFQLFDYTDASVINSNRATTTVAPQALFLMNSDLPLDAAQSLANSLIQNHTECHARLEAAYKGLFGRAPLPAEITRDEGYLVSLRNSPEPLAESAAWASLCHTWLISNEFVYVR